MTLLRATVTLDPVSGIDRDEVQNVWHFNTAVAQDATHRGKVFTFLSGFYGLLAPNLSSYVSRLTNAHKIVLRSVTPGAFGDDDDVVSPIIAESRFTIGAVSGGIPLPVEVACALSFEGVTAGVAEEAIEGTVRPAARRRGRVFIGPLTSTVIIAETTSNRPKFSDTFRNAVLDAYDAQLPGLKTGTSTDMVDHVVYSRANAFAHPVVETSVNDEPDTVRRRGQLTTVRTRRAVVQASGTP